MSMRNVVAGCDASVLMPPLVVTSVLGWGLWVLADWLAVLLLGNGLVCGH